MDKRQDARYARIALENMYGMRSLRFQWAQEARAQGNTKLAAHHMRDVDPRGEYAGYIRAQEARVRHHGIDPTSCYDPMKA